MADSSEPAFLFLYRKGAVAPVDYLSTFATAPLHQEPRSRCSNPQRRGRPRSDRQVAWMDMEDCTNICTICDKNNTSVIIM